MMAEDLRARGHAMLDIAAQLGVARGTLYRNLAAREAKPSAEGVGGGAD